jgi:iron complex transport system substrate-binding protein
MRRWAHRTHLVGLLLWVGVPACRPGDRAPSPGGLAVTDDAGRQVTLARPARRIVSLSPAITELIFALGAGDRLVGRTTWCDYPPAARAVVSVGDALNPNIEAVTARRPDLVILYRSALTETAAQQLERLGIAAAVVRQDRLEDIARAARLVGRLTGRSAVGDSLAGSLERLIAAPRPTPRARLAFIVWDTPPMVIGGGSYLDQLASLAGAANVFHDIPSASATVSLETLAARDPDLIAVLADSGAPAVPAWASRPEWRVLRAVRERRFLVLSGPLFGRPSPRAGAAVAALAQHLGALP